MLCLLTCVPFSQENLVDDQKFTPTLGLPNATKTHPPKKSMSMSCVCTTTIAATKTNPQKKNSPTGWRDGLRVALCVVSALPCCCHKNKPTQKIFVSVLCLHYHYCCHKNKPTQKKDGSPGWQDRSRVVVNRRMTRWMNCPSGWMDDGTDGLDSLI